MTFFSFSKIKLPPPPPPTRGRFSAAFTAAAAGAVPSINVKDTQHEGGRTLQPLPLTDSQESL